MITRPIVKFWVELLWAKIADIESRAGPRGNAILWRPAGGGDATTWAEVMAFVSANKPPLDIYVEGTGSIPAGTYEMRGASLLGVLYQSGAVVSLDDGAVLRNLTGVENNLTLVSHATAAPCLELDAPLFGNPYLILAQKGASYRNEGSVAMLAIPDAAFALLVNLNANAYTTTTPGVPFASLGAGTGFVFLTEGVLGGGTLTDIVTGPGSSLFLFAHDGVPGPYPTQNGFFGTGPLNAPIGVSGGSGPTAQRPVPLFAGSIPLGCLYYDTTLGALIVWNGAAWVLV